MIVFYAHGGSDNHGCEAIIRGTMANMSSDALTYSGNARADRLYGLDKLCEIRSDTYKRYYHRFKWLWNKALSKLIHKNTIFILIDGTVRGTYLSVGGDNYCYPALTDPILKANRRIREKGNKTVLWGTSIESDVLEQDHILNDIRKYDLIFARESITYHALCEKGLKDKTFLFPDPAFAMKPEYSPLPKGLENKKKIVGFNISPLIYKYETEKNVIDNGYDKMIRYLLNETDYDIMLIPHVVKKNNNDLSAIDKLASRHGSSRIHTLGDRPANELKYCISQCDFFVGARTHSTIAAYSSCVPTLVIGYSVKAAGIARDIFGTDTDFVIDVREAMSGDGIFKSFLALFSRREELRAYLEGFMPAYIAQTREAAELLMDYKL